jgi:hypothetical protein
MARSDEDEQCALYMRNRLRDRRPDPAAVRALVLSAHDSAKFDDPERPHFDPCDRDMALLIDSIPFAVWWRLRKRFNESCVPLGHRQERKCRHPLHPMALGPYFLDDPESGRVAVGRLALALELFYVSPRLGGSGFKVLG